MKPVKEMSDRALQNARTNCKKCAADYSRYSLGHTLAAEENLRRLAEVEAEIARRSIYVQREH